MEGWQAADSCCMRPEMYSAEKQPKRTCCHSDAFHAARVCAHGTPHALRAAAEKSSAER